MHLKKILPISAFLFLFSSTIFAQNFTVSGTVKDSRNGEDLIGATVTVKENPLKTVFTNVYGFYSLTFLKGSYTIVYQASGFDKIEIPVVLEKDTVLKIQLSATVDELQGVTVKGHKTNKNVTSTEMSTIKLEPKAIETIPVLFGEKDIMKTLQMMPGIKGAGEGNAGFYVRGGGVDQNLILLDEAPVYNASHVLGFFSIFNSDALKDVTLYKGGMPAEFGGRASSVMDVKMKDGNSKKLAVSGGVGLISSRLTVEAPIKKDKGSFIISARRTYADLFLKLSGNADLKNVTLYFYDLNMKANYTITKRDRLFLSGYFGQDKFAFGSQIGFSWGNKTATLRWNHIFSSKLFSNTSLIFSNYNYQIDRSFSNQTFQIKSSIQDYNLKQDFSYYPNSNNTIKFGVNIIDHTFSPTHITGTAITFGDTLRLKHALEGGIYIQNEQKINKKLSLNYGLRYSMFDYVGKGTAYTYGNDGTRISQQDYTSGQSIKLYGGWEPRISARYQVNKVSSIKASMNRNFQYLHLLSNATTSSPTDLWVPSSNNVKPQIANQVAIGYFRNFKNNMYEVSVETYYKKMYNQIDYKNGAQLFLNTDVESELVYGQGKAYGAEFYVHKQIGKLTGWVSYTLSRTLRQFDQVNNGNWFPARQDRIHDIAIVAMYDITKKIKLSGNWIYYTGNAITWPAGKYIVDGKEIPYFTQRNGSRMPAYHRLDIGITWIQKKTAKYESSWNISIYNVYARWNPYIISFQQNAANPALTEALETSLFRFVPAFSYNFKF